MDPTGILRAPKPGSADLRIYRMMPELTWATWFGPNFDGQFDRDRLSASAAIAEETGRGLLATVTPGLGDVLSDYPGFAGRREALKSQCFPAGFFP